jgi:tRNA threonylcarbamoyladenosine modification (KEOPS) complex  Pcc1 subunit
MVMEKSTPFRVVIISDSFGADARAKLVTERLVHDLHSEAKLISNTWQFEVLSRQGRREQAAVMAREADLIVVSANDDAVLPAHIKTWFRDYLPAKQVRPCALVALLDQQQETQPRLMTLRSYLSEIASEMGMPFLCPEDHWQPLELEHRPEDSPESSRCPSLAAPVQAANAKRSPNLDETPGPY